MKKDTFIKAAVTAGLIAGIQGSGGEMVRTVNTDLILGPNQGRPLSHWPTREQSLVAGFGVVNFSSLNNTGATISGVGEINLLKTPGFTALPQTGLEVGVAFRSDAMVFPGKNVVSVGGTFSGDLFAADGNGVLYVRLGGPAKP